MTDTKQAEFEVWQKFHRAQLDAMGLPEDLHQRLFTKLKFADFDLGENVQLILNEDDEKIALRSTKALKAKADVFLIDHAWTFK